MMKAKHFKLYCGIIGLVITLPLVLTMANLCFNMVRHTNLINEPELSGVSVVPDKPQLSMQTLCSGTFQSGFEDFFADRLVLRKTMTRAYNQILYTVFHATDNSTILVGQDDVLFEKVYATAYITELSPDSILALSEQIGKLERLNTLLNERGIPLVVRISPSKAEHYSDFLPNSYSRFVKMKQAGEYGPNWYQAFSSEIQKTDIPVYDCYELFEQMKADGEVVFAKGGTHWSLAPMAEYINGLNAFMEPLLNRKLGRMIEDSKEVVIGEMGLLDDSDIWNLCWNTFYAKPNYPSPHISYHTVAGEAPLRVFTVGQSFTTVLLGAIYGTQPPLWDETYFSWYDARVIQYPSDVPWGTQISEQTDDFAQYLQMDVILIDFLESGDGACQFEFVDHILQYLEGNEGTT